VIFLSDCRGRALFVCAECGSRGHLTVKMFYMQYTTHMFLKSKATAQVVSTLAQTVGRQLL
jgi:hypothetical protein